MCLKYRKRDFHLNGNRKALGFQVCYNVFADCVLFYARHLHDWKMKLQMRTEFAIKKVVVFQANQQIHQSLVNKGTLSSWNRVRNQNYDRCFQEWHSITPCYVILFLSFFLSKLRIWVNLIFYSFFMYYCFHISFNWLYWNLRQRLKKLLPVI